MSESDNPLVREGHNRPPTFREELEARPEYAALAERAMMLEFRAAKLPEEVKSDEDVAAISAWVVDARALAREADKVREEVKAPILQQGRDVDGVFGAMRDDAKERATRMEDRNKPFLLAKQRAAEKAARRKAEEARLEAERQAEAARQAQAALEAAQKKEDEAVAAKDNEAYREAMHEQGVLQAREGMAAEAAQRAEKEADKADEALASGHRLSRTAGGGGAATVATVWRAKVGNPMELLASLGPLGSFFTDNEVNAALDRAAKAKERPTVPGVVWIEDAAVKTHALRKRL